jgi:hypothetical protein
MLQLSAAEFAKIATGCASAEQCELTFEGTLRDLVLSPDQPTSVAFSNVRVIRAHSS